MVGPSTEELESFKELIKFDHEYYKPTVVGSVASVQRAQKSKTSPSRKAVSIIKPQLKAAVKAPVVKQEPQLAIAEADLANLSQSLEELIDLDTLLQEDLNSTDAGCRVENTATDFPAVSVKAEDNTRCSNKRKLDATETDYTQSCQSTKKQHLTVKTDLDSLFTGSDTFGLDATLSPYSLSPQMNSLSESGYSSDLSGADSPKSDTSGVLGDDAQFWEESFSELFPSLV